MQSALETAFSSTVAFLRYRLVHLISVSILEAAPVCQWWSVLSAGWVTRLAVTLGATPRPDSPRPRLTAVRFLGDAISPKSAQHLTQVISPTLNQVVNVLTQ